MIAAALLLPLVVLAARSLDDWRLDRHRARQAAVEAELAEWAAYRAAFLSARPERIAPGRRRRPVFYPTSCDGATG